MYHRLIATFRRRLMKESFMPSWLSIIVNPFFIIRRGLFLNISTFAPLAEGRLLDIGCGRKPYESLFSNVSEYIGVDIQDSGHNHSNSKVDIYYDGKNLPFDNSSFSNVVSFEVIEHVFDVSSFLKEVNRVLEPNGTFLISLPFAWDEHEAPYDFARYTSFGIKDILKKHGFEVRHCIKTTTYFLAIAQMFIAYAYQHLISGKNIAARLFIVIFLVFPCNVLSLLFDNMFPKKYDYYCNLVVVAHKADMLST